MHALSEQRKGELMIFSELLMFSFFPIIVVLSYATLSGLASLAWSTLFASTFFVCVVTYQKKWHEMWNVQLWKHSVFVALFIGVLFYGFYFIGLEYTTPGNASIIVLFQIFTSFVFFNLYRREHLSLEHKLGAVLMVLGALIILGKGWSGINIGDFIILVGTFFTPLGNYFQQRARKIASSESIMFLRSALSTVVIFPLAYFLGQDASFEDVRASLVFLAVNGILLLGLAKIFFVEGIHRMSVTKAIALGSMTPFFTLLFAWLILSQAPTVWQFLSLVPLVIGILLLTDQVKLKKV